MSGGRRDGILAMIDHPVVNSGIFFPRPDHGHGAPAGARDLFVQVGDGARVHVRMHPHPEGAGSRPAILHFHGNGEIVSDYDELAPAFHAAGSTVCFADFRGYGRSTGTPSVGALLSDAGPILDGTIRALREAGHSGRLFVMGRSLGSAPAIDLAASRPGDVAGLIVESGFARTLPLLAILGIPASLIGLVDVEGDDNEDRMAQVAAPVLILHADGDMIVPLWHAERNLERAASRSKTLVVIPDAGHNDIIAAGGRRYWESIAALVGAAG